MIREATINDLDKLTALEKELFKDDAWSKDIFLQDMNENPYAYIYVYEENNEIVGYIMPWFAYENAELANIGVTKKQQGKGIASKMMDYFFLEANKRGCTKYSLEVRVSNTSAIHLYEKYGFTIVAKRKNYYGDHEDAYLMAKE